MKKIIAYFSMALVLIMLLGCSKTIVCGECGQTKKGKTYTIELFGNSTKEDICDDCIKIVKPLTEGLGGTIK